MKKIDLYVILKTINRVKSIKNAKFAYFLAKNKKIILDEITIIEEAKEKYEKDIQETLTEYNKEKDIIINKVSVKDKDGNVLDIERGKFFIENNKMEEYKTEIEKLDNEYCGMLEKKKEIDEINNKLLEENIKLKGTQRINISDLPDISLEEIEPLMEFIDE